TKSILIPIKQAVENLDDEWKRVASPSVGATSIQTLYPDIGNSLTELRDRLGLATNVARSDAEFRTALGNVYESGRRLIEAIKRTAADPTAPIREELRNKLRAFYAEFHNFGEQVKSRLQESVRAVKTNIFGAVDQALVEILKAPLSTYFQF